MADQKGTDQQNSGTRPERERFKDILGKIKLEGIKFPDKLPTKTIPVMPVLTGFPGLFDMLEASSFPSRRRSPPGPRSGPVVQSSHTKMFSILTDFHPHADLMQEQFNRDLETGRLSETLMEMYRFVDPSHPAALAFQEKMTGITKRLFAGNYNATLHNFRFMISDDPQPNAAVITKAVPPIIMFSKGYIQTMDTEDKWAAALAHELTHQTIFDRIGPHGNSNPEESVADVWGVHLLQRAGYNPRAMKEVMETLEGGGEKRKRTILEALDPHPPFAVRLRNIENAFAIIEQKEPLNDGSTPADRNLQTVIAEPRHQLYIDRRVEEKHRQLGVQNAPKGEQRIALLIQAISELIDEEFLGLHTYLQEPRIKGLCWTIDTLRIIKEKGGLTPEHEAAIFKITDKLVNVGKGNKNREENAKIYYGAFAKVLSGQQYRLTPVGPLADLKQAMEGFINAQTRDEALQQAQIINRVAGRYSFFSSAILTEMYWPDFTIPDKEGVESSIGLGGTYALPWNRHVQWGKDGGPGSEDILKALQCFNINDPSIPHVASTAPIVPRPVEWHKLGYSPADLERTPEGMITGFRKSEQDRFDHVASHTLKISERRYLAELDAEADAVLKNVDWGELETDFRGFVEKYRKYLEPQLTMEPGGQRFAAAFMQHLSALHKSDPQKFNPLIHQFYTGYEPQRLSKEWYIRGAADPCSLPDMIQSYQRRYGASAGITDWNRRNRSFEDDGFSLMTSFNRVKEPVDYVQIGMAPDHPYIRFMTGEARNLFSASEIAESLENVRYRAITRNTPDGFIALDFRAALGYEKPETPEQLLDTVKLLLSMNTKGDLSSLSVIRNTIDVEVYSYLAAQKSERLNLKALQDMLGKYHRLEFSGSYGMDEDLAKHHKARFRQLLEGQIERNAVYELGPDIPVSDLVSSYQFYAEENDYRGSLFVRNLALRKRYEERIMERVSALDDPVLRCRHAENLLFNSNLRDPDFRTWAVNTWVESRALMIKNRLDSSGDRNIPVIADSVIKNARMGQSVAMLSGLLEAIEAQEDVSFAVRDKLVNSFLQKGGKAHLLAAANDHVIDNLADKPELRMATLEFLTSPLTEGSCRAMLGEIRKTNHRIGGFVKELQDYLDEDGSPIPEETKLGKLAEVHRNFWSLPFPARTVYLERVLFPVDETSPAAFQKAVAFVMDRMLPEGKPHSTEARKILNTHLEGCSLPLQRLIFSALITASEKTDEADNEIRPGQILSMVLGRTGAAGGKILQAIHSYDGTPEQIREDVKDSKSGFNKPFRWEIFERINQVYDKDKKEGVHVGRLLGAGSYGYTVELDRGGAETALTLLRENVEREAKYQFDQYKVTTEKLAGEDSRWEPLIGILQNARDMSDVEADFNIAAEQIKAAEGLYNGLSVKVDGRQFNISTAPLLGHSKEYKETALAFGDHFNDLPALTEDQREYRKAAAKAIFTAELFIMLRGGPFDYDRHGAQQRIKGGQITMFDHGSMMFDRDAMNARVPSQQDKAALGLIIADTYEDAIKNGKPVVEALLERLKDTRVYGDSAEYIESFKRGLLALNDFRKYMGDTDAERNDAVQGTIVAVIKSGAVDPVIMRSVTANVDMSGLATFASGSGRSAITISGQGVGGGVSNNLAILTAMIKGRAGRFISGIFGTKAAVRPASVPANARQPTPKEDAQEFRLDG